MKLAGILTATIAAGLAWAVILTTTLVMFGSSLLGANDTDQGGSDTAQVRDEPDGTTEAAGKPPVPSERRVEFDDPSLVDYVQALQLTNANDVRAYWTADRMKNAGRYEMPGAGYTVRGNSRQDTGQDSDSESATGQDSGKGRADDVADIGYPRTIGALFFVAPNGEDASCTASVVGSFTETTIATAAQCVYTPKHGMHTNMMFVPGYDHGAYPELGTWPAISGRTFLEWADDGSWQHDQAFVELYNNADNQTIASVLGWNNLVYDHGPRTENTVAWGYQQVAGQDTDISPYFCEGKTIATDRGEDVGIGCTFSHGAAGGPWFTTNDNRHNKNDIWAISSRMTTDDVLIATRNSPELRSLLASF